MAKSEAVFIGYRREDTGHAADRVYEKLAKRFGRKNVFKDVDSMPFGTDFRSHVATTIGRCKVFLVLIGARWLEAKAAEHRRLDDPEDLVRIEIETALATSGVRVVPVLLDGATIPSVESLPPSLQTLPSLNAATIRRDPDFPADIRNLARIIARERGSSSLIAWSIGGAVLAAAIAAGWLIFGPAIAQQMQDRVQHSRELAAIAQGEAEHRRLEALAPNYRAASQVLASPLLAASLPRGSVFRDCAYCPEMVIVPAGAFLMGAPADEASSPDEPGSSGHLTMERPQHTVHVASFALGEFAVTYGEWQNCVRDGGCRSNPTLAGSVGQVRGVGRWPVVSASWDDAQEFIAWLNARAPNARYRLPSEAEWEYAARAGTTTPYYTGSDLEPYQANFAIDPSNSTTKPVGSYHSNPFGLYDMAGNVWQWVQDCGHPDYTGAPNTGEPWMTPGCTTHILRGGSFDNAPRVLRSAARFPTDTPDDDAGFRVARTLVVR